MPPMGRDYMYTKDLPQGTLVLVDARPTRIVAGILTAYAALEDALQAAQDISLEEEFCAQLRAALSAVHAIRTSMEPAITQGG